jgi:hypothetical protein
MKRQDKTREHNATEQRNTAQLSTAQSNTTQHNTTHTTHTTQPRTTLVQHNTTQNNIVPIRDDATRDDNAREFASARDSHRRLGQSDAFVVIPGWHYGQIPGWIDTATLGYYGQFVVYGVKRSLQETDSRLIRTGADATLY